MAITFVACTLTLTETYTESAYRVIAWSLKQQSALSPIWSADQFRAQIPVLPALGALLSFLIDGGSQSPVSLAAIRFPNSVAACVAMWMCFAHLRQNRVAFYASCVPLFVCLHVAPFGLLSLALVSLLKSFENQSRLLCLAATVGLLLYGDIAWTLSLFAVAIGLLFTAKRNMARFTLFSFFSYFVVLFFIGLSNEFVHSHLFLYYWNGFGHMWYASPRPLLFWYGFACVLMIPGLLHFKSFSPALALAACYFYFVRDANQLLLEKALPFAVLACWNQSTTVTAPRWVRFALSTVITIAACAVFSEDFQLPLFGTSVAFANEWLFQPFQLLFYFAAVFSFVLFVMGRLRSTGFAVVFAACWLSPLFLFQASEKADVLKYLDAQHIKLFTVMGDLNPWWLLEKPNSKQAPIISTPNDWPLTGSWFVTEKLRGGKSECDVLLATPRFENQLYVVCEKSEN